MDKQIENNSYRSVVLIEIRITAATRYTNYPSLISRFIGFLCNNPTIPCEIETFIHGNVLKCLMKFFVFMNIKHFDPVFETTCSAPVCLKNLFEKFLSLCR